MTIRETGAVLAVAIPVLVFVITLFCSGFPVPLAGQGPPDHRDGNLPGDPRVSLMAAAHVPISVALIVLCFAPALVVVAMSCTATDTRRVPAEQSTGH